MKLLRIGKKGHEIPVAIDKNGKYRNLSAHINDLNPDTINFETLDILKNINLENLDEIDQKEKGGQWVKGKSGDTFGLLGLYLVTKDEIEDIDSLNLTLDVNGNRHQIGNTNHMIFNFNFLIAHITSFITLMPGDLVTTGIPPGVGLGMNPSLFLKDGDKMTLTVDNLGSQNRKVVAE
jgi:2-keto-4-pentenoate hydratase/2-oxohepta-3-ene-1,7-dioic acid hydratase in catechol pathway